MSKSDVAWSYMKEPTVYIEKAVYNEVMQLVDFNIEIRHDRPTVIARRLERAGFDEMGRDFFAEEFPRWEGDIRSSGRAIISVFHRKRSAGMDVVVICEGYAQPRKVR